MKAVINVQVLHPTAPPFQVLVDDHWVLVSRSDTQPGRFKIANSDGVGLVMAETARGAVEALLAGEDYELGDEQP